MRRDRGIVFNKARSYDQNCRTKIGKKKVVDKRPIDSELVARMCKERLMEWAVAAMLLPSGHPIHSFIKDGIALCVWL